MLVNLLFILSVLLMGKYLTIFLISLLSNPPKRLEMRKWKSVAVDEILLTLSVSYFFTYILF